GYHVDGEKPVRAEHVDMGTIFTAGGMYSTVRDLYLWDREIRSPQVVPPHIFAAAHRPGPGGYGLGWRIDEGHGRKRIHHGGIYRGYLSEHHIYPEDDFSVIALTNFDFVP